jgi:hypothetical protein
MNIRRVIMTKLYSYMPPVDYKIILAEGLDGLRQRAVATVVRGLPSGTLSFARRILPRWLSGVEPIKVGIALTEGLHDWGSWPLSF